MNRFIRTLLAAAGLLGVATGALAQTTPLRIEQDLTLYNLQSRAGVPISDCVSGPNSSPCSNGIVPIPSADLTLAQTNQFRSWIAFGGVAAPRTPSNLSPNSTMAANAVQIGLPTGNNGITTMFMLRAQVGAPFLSRQISFLFGDIVKVPETDEDGKLLSATNDTLSSCGCPRLPIAPENYWRAEPYSTNNHDNAPYYWSIHKPGVFAVQSGPIRMTWIRANPLTTQPANYLADTNKYFVNGANYFRLKPVDYVVSGSPVQAPRQMYWTEKSFQSIGKPINVPDGLVGQVKVVYNTQVPERVTNEVVVAGVVPVVTTNNLLETRTLWHEYGQIHAYNTEGRVFVELLGESLGGGRLRHLGFEIVDVSRAASPTDVTTELGERLRAYQTTAEGDDSGLFPEPLSAGLGGNFAYQHNLAGSGRVEYYATAETRNPGDYQVHWLEAGVMGLKWPYRFVRYKMVWPARAAQYSHYVRPAVTSDAEAQLTAVPLPTANVPVISYQDSFQDQTTPLRARLTADYKFYTWLDAAVPAHRTLLRFNSGENVAFERVFSWLDPNLQNTNYTAFDGTVAAGLKEISDYRFAVTNYQSLYAAYLTNRMRGVNGDWKLYVRDDAAGGAGVISNWVMVVDTTNEISGTVSTREFTNSTLITITDNTTATPSPSPITVSGITNAVTAIRVRLNGLTHPFPDDVDAFLVGPRTNFCALVSDAGAEPSNVVWTARGVTTNWTAVASSADGNKLVAVAGPTRNPVTVGGGQIFTSTDAGVTWTARAFSLPWAGVASSSDGTRLVAAVQGGFIYTSTDSGTNWIARDSARNWSAVASSTNGTKLVALAYGGQIYTSSDSGLNWTPRGVTANWASVASSSDGSKLVAVVRGGQIHTSTDSGTNWTARDSSRDWSSVASSADGTKLVAVNFEYPVGTVYRSTDSGATWTPSTDPILTSNDRWWTGVASSADGTMLVAVNNRYNPGDYIYVSTDSGATWRKHMTDTPRRWNAAAMSADGSKLVAVDNGFGTGGRIYTYTTVGISNVNLVFDDAAPGPVPTNGPLASGTYRPTDYAPADTVPPGVINTNTTTTLAALLLPAVTAPLPPTFWAGQTSPTLPRVVSGPAVVGQRLDAPANEPGATGNYLAGHIHTSAGTLYNVNAYVDPLAGGFEAANQGAIIPVNAIPGANHLEVWWFRPHSANAGAYAADAARGFQPIYWPAVIGRYTIQWPAASDEIVLASNDGSGALPSLQARGSIYVQNDRSQHGYNPNEEHALMQGGQAWALRDDLNLTNTPATYSSEPYVLLDYTESDGRPATRAFKVLREKGDMKFNYEVEAGAVLQPPMPLPLLEKPFAPKVIGEAPRSLNQEVYFRTVASSTTNGVLTTAEPHQFLPWFRALALQNSDFSITKYFFVTNADYDSKTFSGVVSASKPYSLATYSGTQPTSPAHRFRYALTKTAGLTVGQAVFVVAPSSATAWPATNITVNTDASVELEFDGTVNTVDPDTIARLNQATLLIVSYSPAANNALAGYQLRSEPVPKSRIALQGQLTIQDRKGNLWVYRGPHMPDDPQDKPMFSMKFYYKTLPGFFFPSLALNAQPLAGNVTPYLRSYVKPGDAASGYPSHANPVYGDSDLNGVADDNALEIRYSPVWPKFAPVLQMAETLTVPKRGLPAMRGQTSLELVYQQSTFKVATNVTVRLHDPTWDKEFQLGPPDGDDKLGKIPASVKIETSRGKTYFPLLAPHLSQRFFFDPNRPGGNGALVFRGEFVDDIVGEKYLHLNVLSGKDRTNLYKLCVSDDPKYGKWTEAIDQLATRMEKFVEAPQRPGTYAPGGLVVTNGPADLCEVTHSDVAVDSYALTAVGPGTGYVTLIAGNGLAFTPVGEPVSVLVMKVSDVLYPGELKIIASLNPLAETLTLQQVVDLAGQPENFEFQWKIAGPVDGLPPEVYRNEYELLLDDGVWKHVPFPLSTEDWTSISSIPASRVADLGGFSGSTIVAVSNVAFVSVITNTATGTFEFNLGAEHQLTSRNQLVVRGELAANNALVVSNFAATVFSITATSAVVKLVPQRTDLRVLGLSEAVNTNQPQSLVYREFTVVPTNYSQLWLSLDLDGFLGAKVYLNGTLVVTANLATNTPVNSPPGSFGSALAKAYRLADATVLANFAQGGTQRVTVELFSQAAPGVPQAFNLHLEARVAEDQTDMNWVPLGAAKYPDGLRATLGEMADVQALSDNYLIMRYRAKPGLNYSPGSTTWSRWTTPQLAEGWIKRVLAGINPFNQRVKDLFNSQVNTDASILTSAGHRWEGDVALSLESINNYGLIEIYETVLRRGRLLSIDYGINYGPANDALLLAAGYLNDLYVLVGNEASADAANPTIGIGTADHTYGDIATALFAFKGQVPNLLAEELALLRGRDDFLQPGVQVPPVYNRMFWNYTRGIDAGEVIYALNYNIQEDPNRAPDGTVNAADAARMFPMGHGDAYGHYLTALKGYYSLLLNENFDWVPRIEAVTVLGVPVSVDYQDERKFATAAAAVARTGRQVMDQTWRQDYQSGPNRGWEHLGTSRPNPAPPGRERYWGVDHWAARTGQGAYLNWIVGNSMLPDVDPDPTHETGSIQKIDRTTVPELRELATVMEALQTDLDSAEGGLTPMNLPAGSLAFDINPNLVVGANPSTHFEQVYARALGALNNAVTAFDDAKDVTRLMRSEQDSLNDFQNQVARQELAFTNSLIELYGTLYADDIGPGRTFKQGFAGPDLLHYMYADDLTLADPPHAVWGPNDVATYKIDIQTLPPDWGTMLGLDTAGFNTNRGLVQASAANYTEGLHYIAYPWGPHGFLDKPASWTGRRSSPGKIQEAISRVIAAHDKLYVEITANMVSDKEDLDKAIQLFLTSQTNHTDIRNLEEDKLIGERVLKAAQTAWDVFDDAESNAKELLEKTDDATQPFIPRILVLGTASGTDPGGAAAAAKKGALGVAATAINVKRTVVFAALKALEYLTERNADGIDFYQIAPAEWNQERREQVVALGAALKQVQGDFIGINAAIRSFDDAQQAYRALVAQGDRIQEERLIARQRTAAVVQGYRTRDAAFRIFRNEKLERYKSLFDLAARYAFLAANAYDYETGLLHTDAGHDFINRIVSARALGVVRHGEPQFAGSNTGDPGLSSALAEMKADWDVLKGRLGFNNPDAYGTTASLRMEHFRILPGASGDQRWRDTLQSAWKANILEDDDVRRHCLQIDPGGGAPVPGIVLEFNTVIGTGLNLFGQQLGPGDHAFSPSSFATKIYAAGVALEGYRGMSDPAANAGAGGNTPPDPNLWFLDPDALAATPYIYLLPVGVDSMRSPPLGDASVIRSWSVQDVTIPLPFNIGASLLSSGQFWRSQDFLSEPLFNIRKHQAFRPVSSSSVFSFDLYGSNGQLMPSQFTNRRLVGRSVWNSRWKIVIPGNTLLADPDEGLARFVRSVRDVQLHLVTYSYSGN